jgi:hypothetical protein
MRRTEAVLRITPVSQIAQALAMSMQSMSGGHLGAPGPAHDARPPTGIGTVGRSSDQLAGARQSRQSHRITPVRLDAIAGAAGDFRRRDHLAHVTSRSQFAHQSAAAGPCFVHD